MPHLLGCERDRRTSVSFAMNVSRCIIVKYHDALRVGNLAFIFISGSVFAAGAGKRFLADVSIAVAHVCAFIAHYRHNDGIGHTGILEQ